MRTVDYRGYTATITYDRADRLYVGRVIEYEGMEMQDVVAFDGKTPAQAMQSFKNVILEYEEDELRRKGV